MKGIYIVANDKVMDNAIALLNSIRLRDREIPIYLIPFNNEYQMVLATLSKLHNVQLFPDLELLERVTSQVGNIFDRNFLALPNKMRKLAVWFGVLDEFLYIDTDIVVFEKISDRLDRLSEIDFFCSDYHFASEGLRNIFSPVIREKNIFTDEQLQDVFNSGFWGSKKGIITEEQLYDVLKECSQHREYFDFTQGVTDQPVLNYLILKCFSKRENLVKASANVPGSWAGSKHFENRNYVLYDKDQPLQYIHWAGISMHSGAPYWDIWQHYRYLHEPKNFWRSLSRLVPFAGAK
ncbi:Npun_R2821/Npun_R2822 family protein [Myxacorys almedinensis]|uniref:Methionine synthase n=1 Tax=Myxacorys almedinensis A TaxID=2690445 RepID=A0A8J8CMG3_9CYAN|nr:Npun_R2821/Npun_R2822 family protein [Myxacorys almedinensis]NDJ17222.1 methionine synthase [Myxacorys almedinensis A]